PHLGLLCVLILTACSSTPDGPDTQPAGFVVGDEPDAVRAAASILAEPGSAADAATAMYFALAVTYPIAAGLGGGGLCTVYDPSSGRSEAFSFLPRAPAAGGAFAMPGNVAGFAALQGAFGKLPWQRDIARAEQLATTGFAISPALAARLATAQDLVRLDASLASEFLDESGHPKPAGSHVANRELGETLALIRTNGSAGFYRGDITASIAAYVAVQGGAVLTGELAGYRPLRAQASASTFGSANAYLPSPQVAPGNFTSALLANVRCLMTGTQQF